jgi:hypothetical protein
MANIPELLDGRVTLEVECPDPLYLNVYIRRQDASLPYLTTLK